MLLTLRSTNFETWGGGGHLHIDGDGDVPLGGENLTLSQTARRTQKIHLTKSFICLPCGEREREGKRVSRSSVDSRLSDLKK